VATARRGERYRVRIGKWLANQLKALGCPGRLAFPGTYVKWREEMNKLIRDAGVGHGSKVARSGVLDSMLTASRLCLIGAPACRSRRLQRSTVSHVRASVEMMKEANEDPVPGVLNPPDELAQQAGAGQ
jgi:hypothetical protein